jgi:hypothetical protein
LLENKSLKLHNSKLFFNFQKAQEFQLFMYKKKEKKLETILLEVNIPAAVVAVVVAVRETKIK